MTDKRLDELLALENARLAKLPVVEPEAGDVGSLWADAFEGIGQAMSYLLPLSMLAAALAVVEVCCR